MEKWFKVFRAGTHTDSQGRIHTFSNEDVEKIASTYNEQTDHVAPLVKGHPADNEPAHGWVEKLKFEGGELFAKFKDFSKDIISDIKEKKFQFPSISVYKNGLLRHVGLLGAVPPAVKGLGGFELSEDIEGKEAAVFSFNENFEKEGYTTFDYQEEQKEDLSKVIDEQKKKIETLTKQVGDLKSFADDNSKLKEQIQFAEADQAAAEAKLKDLSLKMRLLEFQQYLNEKIAYGSLTPVQSRKVLKLVEALDTVNLSEHEGKQVFEFSDVNEKGEAIKVKENPVDVLKEFVESLPKVINTNETNPDNVSEQNNEADFAEFTEKYPNADKEQIQLLVDAKKLMKAENISFENAIIKVNSNKK